MLSAQQQVASFACVRWIWYANLIAIRRESNDKQQLDEPSDDDDEEEEDELAAAANEATKLSER